MDFTPSRRTRQVAGTPAPRPHYEKLAPIKRRRRRFPSIGVLLALIIVAAVAVLGTYMFIHRPAASPTAQTSSGSQAEDTGQVVQGNPSFQALAPAGKDVSWTHLTPPNSADFYAFTDRVEGVSIRVTEQTLPDNFIDNPTASLAQLAHDYNANRNLSVNGITVYIGTSTKAQQSLLFTTDSLLVLITSDSTLNDKQWTDYITSLQ